MNINGKTFTIGADPEVFMGKNGVFVSAHDAVPGTKAQPHFVEGGAVQVDGMALEFNINPSSSEDEFQTNMNLVTKTLSEMIGDHEFLDVASVIFDEKFLEGVPSFNKVLGCSSDFNGWTFEENQKPDGNMLMRTAGGHIHVGGFETNKPYHMKHYKASARLARCMDYTLGLPSLLWDTDDKRRSMYGQAGCFRPKGYGMEYRTLSNKWIFSEKLTSFVYNATQKAIELAFFSDFEPEKAIRDIIDNSDRKHPLMAGFSNPLEA